jgi:type IV secretory pathway VirB10-like protein
MNNKITNPVLKQIISEIGSKTTSGRMTISWGTLNEAKKKSPKNEAKKKFPPQPEAAPQGGNDEPPAPENNEPPQAPEAPEPQPSPEPAPEAPDLGAGGPAPADAAAEPPAEDPSATDGGEEVEADAVQAKAKLEKAKAEKDQAEDELKKQTHINLTSQGGTQFLLSKLLDQAYKGNTIDALAGEMVQKLKIQTPEDMTAFSEETAPFRIIPGMAELLSSMQTLATKQPETTEEPGV